MTDRQLTVIAGGKPVISDERDARRLRSRLAGSGAEFVARLDLKSAQARFSELLELRTDKRDAGEDAAALYKGFTEEFPAEPTPVPLNRHRAVDDATLGGAVKWFDIARGYGFVVPDNGLPDAYLHVNTLRLSGIRRCPEGARVICLIARDEHGYRVTTVQAVDYSTAIDPSRLPRRDEPLVGGVTGWALGRVRSFNWRRGSGVVALVDGREVQLALSTLRRCGMVYVEADDVFDVLVGEGDKGAFAVEVRLPGTRQSN